MTEINNLLWVHLVRLNGLVESDFDGFRRVTGCRGRFVILQLTRTLIEQGEIRESAADIDSNPVAHANYCLPVAGLVKPTPPCY